MNELLENKYPYLTNFFKAVFDSQKQNVANSLIFYGSDVLVQYYFALSVAKTLNCTGSKDENCNCVNCNWIKENRHPAVMTISKVDNKNDKSKTVISKEQVDSMQDLLVNSSDYHRVFIFCDADFKILSEKENERINSFKDLKVALPESESDELSWFPKGLTRECFQDVAANSLLKSIEEPPSDVTFIFLTEDKNDLIQTIISRSQSFFVPNFNKEEYEIEFLEDYFQDYPDFNKDIALKLSKFLFDYQVENNLTAKYILDCIQFYLKEIIKSNLGNKLLVLKAYSDIEKVQESKKMLDSYVKEQLVYEDLAFYLAKT